MKENSNESHRGSCCFGNDEDGKVVPVAGTPHRMSEDREATFLSSLLSFMHRQQGEEKEKTEKGGLFGPPLLM